MRTHYDILAPHTLTKKQLAIDEALFASMWELFLQIGVFWENGDFLGSEETHASYQAQLLSFMINRIDLNAQYLLEYRNARKVIDELKETHGVEAGYVTLFTSSPKSGTLLDSAKSKVSDEFILLQLALGGFKAFGATNYPGYFGGANIQGQTPYRTME